jgi:hypothetical protein
VAFTTGDIRFMAGMLSTVLNTSQPQKLRSGWVFLVPTWKPPALTARPRRHQLS